MSLGRNGRRPIEPQLAILSEAIKFWRRVHGADAGVPSPCRLAFQRHQLDKLLIRQKHTLRNPLTSARQNRLALMIGAARSHVASWPPGGLVAIAKLVDDENAAVRRGPVKPGRVGQLLGERAVRIARDLHAKMP